MHVRPPHGAGPTTWPVHDADHYHAAGMGADPTGTERPVAQDEHERIAAAFQSLPQQWQVVLWHAEVLREPLHRIGARISLEPEAVTTLLTLAREGLQSAYHAIGEIRDTIPVGMTDRALTFEPRPGSGTG